MKLFSIISSTIANLLGISSWILKSASLASKCFKHPFSGLHTTYFPYFGLLKPQTVQLFTKYYIKEIYILKNVQKQGKLHFCLFYFHPNRFRFYFDKKLSSEASNIYIVVFKDCKKGQVPEL